MLEVCATDNNIGKTVLAWVCKECITYLSTILCALRQAISDTAGIVYSHETVCLLYSVGITAGIAQGAQLAYLKVMCDCRLPCVHYFVATSIFSTLINASLVRFRTTVLYLWIMLWISIWGWNQKGEDDQCWDKLVPSFIVAYVGTRSLSRFSC